MGGHGFDNIVHGWAWAQAKLIWKGTLNELSFNAFEGKSTESPSPSKVSPPFSVSSSSKVLGWFMSVPCSKNYISNWNLYCISKSIVKHQQKSYWKSKLPWFGYAYQKCMLVDFLTGRISPPTCVHRWVWSIYLKHGDVIRFLSRMCMYCVCSLILTTPIKIYVWIKENNQLTLAYLEIIASIKDFSKHAINRPPNSPLLQLGKYWCIREHSPKLSFHIEYTHPRYGTSPC